MSEQMRKTLQYPIYWELVDSEKPEMDQVTVLSELSKIKQLDPKDAELVYGIMYCYAIHNQIEKHNYKNFYKGSSVQNNMGLKFRADDIPPDLKILLAMYIQRISTPTQPAQ